MTSTAQDVRLTPDGIRSIVEMADGDSYALMDVCYDGCRTYFLTTTDSGRSWTEAVSNDLDSIKTLFVLQSELYGSTLEGLIQRSGDRGITWSYLPLPPKFTEYKGEATVWAMSDQSGLMLLKTEFENPVLWFYDLSTKTWSEPVTCPRRTIEVHKLRDGRIVANSLLDGTLFFNADTRQFDPWTPVDLPDDRKYKGTYSLDGQLIAIDDRKTHWLVQNNEVVLLAVNPDSPSKYHRIRWFDDKYVLFADRWYLRSAPATPMMYSSVADADTIQPITDFIQTPSRLLLRVGNVVYSYTTGQQLAMTLLWQFHGALNVRYGLLNNGTMVATSSPETGKSHASVSYDHGISFVSATFDDPCASKIDLLNVLPDGRVWVISKEGCNYISSDGGLTYRRLPDFDPSWIIRSIHTFSDGSFSLLAGIDLNFFLYRGTSVDDRDLDSTYFTNGLTDSGPGLMARMNVVNQASVLRTTTDRKNWNTLFAVPERDSANTSVYIKLINENEIAVVANRNGGGNTPTRSIARIIDARSNTYETIGPFDFAVVDMVRLESGRLLILRGDFSFMLLDDDNNPTQLFSDPLVKRGSPNRDLGLDFYLIQRNERVFAAEINRGLCARMIGSITTSVGSEAEVNSSQVVLPTVAPNPITSHVMISNVPTGSFLSIVSMDGKIMHQEIAVNPDVYLNTSAFAAGTYAVQITTESRAYSVMFVVSGSH